MGENARLKNLLKKIKINESTISMLLGALVVVVVGALIINYFRNVNRFPEKKEEVTGSEEIEPKAEELPTIHIVQKGDNLWKIAEKYWGSGYNWLDIAKENKLAHPNLLTVGVELKIPKTAVIKPPLAQKGKPVLQAITGDTYTVVKGDNLWKIAVRAYGDGFQWVIIARENNLANPSLIHPGNILKIQR